MIFTILNITLKEYQYYGSFVIFFLWIFIAIQLIRDSLNFRKVAREKNVEIFKYFSLLTVRRQIKKDTELDAAYKFYRKRGFRLFALWVLACIAFVVGAAIIKN